jgi:hypothetical protein
VKRRCLDCLGTPCLCADCCLITHRQNPFHKIEGWTGLFWRPAWLWHVGTVVCLGHGQNPCPKYEASLEALEACLISVNAPNVDEDNSYSAMPKKHSIGSGNIVCFLHTNGFHYLPVFPCWCSEAPDDDLQFINSAFYLASWKQIKTALTFTVLKDFHLFKIQAHMSTEMFLELMCHFTNASSRSMTYPHYGRLVCWDQRPLSPPWYRYG